MFISSLEQIPLFSALPPDEIRNLADNMQLSEYPPGEVLFREGDPGDRFSILLEGEIEIIKALGTPEERTLSVLRSGDFMGEMSLFYRQGMRSASARTRSHVHLLEMSRADFDQLIHRQPDLAVSILRSMSARIREGENATIRDLQEKNRQLSQAYRELQAAQAQLIEKEMIEHELQVARKIQESMLPKEMPVIEGWELSAYWQPARAVSGDFYDFLSLPGGRLGLVIGDVSGKGVPASLVMATTCSLLRATAKNLTAPGEILANVNAVLCENILPNMFVTCQIAVLEPASGRITLANAGHNLPFHVAEAGVTELHVTGMPLGIFPDRVYEQIEIQLANRQGLLFFSDGISEAHNSDGEMYGLARLQGNLQAYQANQPASPAGLVPYLTSQLACFTGPDWEQEDDVTLLTLRMA